MRYDLMNYIASRYSLLYQTWESLFTHVHIIYETNDYCKF